MSISDYSDHLKSYADGLVDLGFPVSEPTQVLTLLRGLSAPYRNMASIIKTKDPMPNFIDACSMLALEEADIMVPQPGAATALVTTPSSSTAIYYDSSSIGSAPSPAPPRQEQEEQLPVQLRQFPATVRHSRCPPPLVQPMHWDVPALAYAAQPRHPRSSPWCSPQCHVFQHCCRPATTALSCASCTTSCATLMESDGAGECPQLDDPPTTRLIHGIRRLLTPHQ